MSEEAVDVLTSGKFSAGTHSGTDFWKCYRSKKNMQKLD